MAFIRTVPADKAEGILYEIYQEDMKTKGYVANHTSAFEFCVLRYIALGRTYSIPSDPKCGYVDSSWLRWQLHNSNAPTAL